MAWKIYLTLGRPKAKIVWDNVLYKTTLTVNGEVVEPGKEIAVNVNERPNIKLTLVAENEGDSGVCWVAVLLRDKMGRSIPLFLKQMVLKTGQIIVAVLDFNVDIDFLKFIRDTLGSSEYYEIVGYAGSGDLIRALRVYGIPLPFAYIRDITSGRVYSAEDEDDIIRAVEHMIAGTEVTELGPIRVIARSPTIDIISIQPIEIESLRIKIKPADAGFDFYHMYRNYKDEFTRSGVSLPFGYDWSVIKEMADDSTEVVR